MSSYNNCLNDIVERNLIPDSSQETYKLGQIVGKSHLPAQNTVRKDILWDIENTFHPICLSIKYNLFIHLCICRSEIVNSVK